MLYLANSGLLSFRKPYIVEKSPELRPENALVAFVNVSVVPMDREHILENQIVVLSVTWPELTNRSFVHRDAASSLTSHPPRV